MNREIETKTDRIVELLNWEKLGGVLLNAQHNFSWITGGASNGIDLSRENGAASVLVRRDGQRFLLASNIEMPRMFSEEVSRDDFELVEYPWQDEKTSGDFLIEKARALTDQAMATDIVIHSTAPTIEAKIAPCRYELTDDEIVRFRELGTDAGESIRDVVAKISPGETEIEIAAKMRAELGARNIASVVTLVAADERITKYRHSVPTDNRWRKTLLLVTCAKRNGLIASLSRIVCVGDVPSDLREKTEAAAFVNASLWNATRPGVSGAQLYQFAADAYASIGFADEIDKHHQGGAAGYKTREWVAHPKSAEIVQTNQAFAWNPSLTGTKVEETVIVTPNGVDVITTSPEMPAITTEIEGQKYRSPGIIEL